MRRPGTHARRHSWRQIVPDRDPDLARIAELQKGLIGVVGRYQTEKEALLGITHIEQVPHPDARAPGTAAIADPQILQMIGMRGLRVAGVVVEAVERVRIEPREPTAGRAVFHRGGELVTRRKWLRAPVDAEALEHAPDTQVACAQQRGAPGHLPARAQSVAAL